MKAQISLEYLTLSVVALVILSISSFALVKIKENTEKSLELIALKQDLTVIYNAAEDVCALGDGNSRLIELDRKIYLLGKTQGLEASYGQEISTAKNLTCEISANGWFGTKMVVYNQEGKIIIGET